MTKATEKSVNLKGNAPDDISLSESEQAEARKEGAKEAAKEAGKDAYRYLTDGNLPGDPPKHQHFGADEIMPWEPLLSLGIEAFEDAIAEGAEDPVPEEKVVGLLRLERNGQNRTSFVQAMMKRLGLKTKEELYAVSPGGPDYTNDTTPVTKL